MPGNEAQATIPAAAAANETSPTTVAWLVLTRAELKTPPHPHESPLRPWRSPTNVAAHWPSEAWRSLPVAPSNRAQPYIGGAAVVGPKSEYFGLQSP